MKLLRRVVYWQAALWVLWGAVAGAVPRWMVRSLLSQPPLSEYAWLRAAGVMAVVLAMLMVLVAQRIEELWWWCWAFTLLELGTAAVFVINALFGLPAGAAAWPWWLLAGVNGAFGLGLLVGLALAGNEEPLT